MFVFDGTRVPYRKVLNDGKEWVETLVDYLPRGAEIITREKVAGVDSDNFVRYSKRFVNDVSDLTEKGRKMLLLYDGYRSHMMLRALEILHEGGVIAYALPAHTSGLTQPLDLSCFNVWK